MINDQISDLNSVTLTSNFSGLTKILLVSSNLPFLIVSIQIIKSGLNNSLALEVGQIKSATTLKPSLLNFSAFNDPSLVQFMHRNLAYFIIFFYLLIFITVYKNKLSFFFKLVNIVGLLLFLQIILGILTLLFSAHIIIASMHQISSIFLVSSGIYLVYLNSNINLQLLD